MSILTILLFLCQLPVIWAYDAPQVCHQQPYKQIECLKQYAPAKSFCAKHYPVQPAIKTSTAQVVTVTKTTGTTTITKGVSTRTIPLRTSTAIKETTAYTTITLQGQKFKRDVGGYTASLYSSLIARESAVVRTACACIQTPSTRTVWVTPTSTIRAKKTIYVQGTTTKFIRPTTTKYVAVTKTVTLYSTTPQRTTTSTRTTSRSSTTSITSSQRTSTTSGSTTRSSSTTRRSSSTTTVIGGSVPAPPCPASREDICASTQLTCSSSTGVSYDTECGVEYTGDEITVGRQRKRAVVDTFDQCQALCEENRCIGLNYIGTECTIFSRITGSIRNRNAIGAKVQPSNAGSTTTSTTASSSSLSLATTSSTPSTSGTIAIQTTTPLVLTTSSSLAPSSSSATEGRTTTSSSLTTSSSIISSSLSTTTLQATTSSSLITSSSEYTTSSTTPSASIVTTISSSTTGAVTTSTDASSTTTAADNGAETPDAGTPALCSPACSGGNRCVDGQCVCPAPRTQCNSFQCADLSNDRSNCGSCGNRCPVREMVCSAGRCHYPCLTDGETNCPSRSGPDMCVNTLKDRNNCGTCGNRCSDAQRCSNGSCVDPGCGEDETYCTFADKCTNIQSDSGNCGSCGFVCPSDQPTCSRGRCLRSRETQFCSKAGQTFCTTGDVGCYFLNSDAQHCGSCGNACAETETCESGICTPPPVVQDPTPDPLPNACSPGLEKCFAFAGDTGTCTDLKTNTGSCGACNRSCSPGEVCENGSCRLPYCPAGVTCPPDAIACTCISSPAAATSTSTTTSTTSTSTTSTTTIPAVANAPLPTPDCGSGLNYCSSTNSCVDFAGDNDNCGACDTACPSDKVCVTGTCRGPESGFCREGITNCSGSCKDLKTSKDSCGSCGKQCGSLEQCINGACVCPPERVLCKNAFTGDKCVAPAYFLNSPDDCGRCGNKCDFGQRCINGGCECAAGTIPCRGDCRTQSEFLDDVKNCGRCGKDCGDNSLCSSGECQCKAGSTNCMNPDSWKANFYDKNCVDLQTDRDNCGQCGLKCEYPQEFCKRGRCYCTWDPEVYGLMKWEDPKNCGTCGRVCPVGGRCLRARCECFDKKARAYYGVQVKPFANVVSYCPSWLEDHPKGFVEEKQGK